MALFKNLHIHLDRTNASNLVKDIKQTTKFQSKLRNRESESAMKSPKLPQMPRKAVENIRKRTISRIPDGESGVSLLLVLDYISPVQIRLEVTFPFGVYARIPDSRTEILPTELGRNNYS